MKRKILGVLVALMVCGAELHAAPAAKNYQVTGPIVELTDTKIVVQKGDEKWEIARSAETKVEGQLKIGAKVTVFYTMSAKSVEVKAK